MIFSGPILPFAALAFPLLLGLLAAVPLVRRHALLLLPLAALPALALALLGPTGVTTQASFMLLDVRLGLDQMSALFLGASALLWAIAGLYATAYLRLTHRREVFVGFWCLTLTGNLGVFLAQDAVTFYVSFTAVSLPAYILIVHDGAQAAFRAGRIYIILALVGETALLSGLIVACTQAGSLAIADLRDALLAAPGRDAAVALMVLGLGIKAGLVPLHVWLPLAHPEAPTPASAVLSGAIVKAGIFGMIVLLPAGSGMDGWSLALVAVGLFGAYAGVVLGLGQSDAKAALAYSTVSQMGLMIAATGVAMRAEDPGHVGALVALYAVHHGMAKGALFLSVGVADKARYGRVALLAVVALVGLSVAGLPLSGGAVAKTALKSGMEGLAGTLVGASAIGTALLLFHVWLLLRQREADDDKTGGGFLLWVPFLTASVAALALPWMLLPAAGLEARYILSPANLWSAAWPLLAAAAIAAAALFMKLSLPQLPPGDLVVMVERIVPPLRTSTRNGRAHPKLRIARLGSKLEQLEDGLRDWSVAGPLLLATTMLFVALFAA